MIEIKCTEKERIKLEPFLKDYACATHKCINDCTNCLDNIFKWNIQPEPLNPCPFCGGKAYAHTYGNTTGSQEYIHCTNCGIATRLYEDKKAAVEAWNRRIDDVRQENS